MVQPVRWTIPQLLDTVFDVPVALVVQFVFFPVVAQRRLPMVFETIESPQFPVGTVIDVPVVMVVRVGRALCTGTGPGLIPAIRTGKGWRRRWELAPRRSATRIRCMPVRSYR